MVNLIIDGKNITAKEDTMLLEVIRGAGITIPTLCAHEAVSRSGACRLCVVEIKKGNRTRIVTSCLYAAEDGLIVDTKSERKRTKIVPPLHSMPLFYNKTSGFVKSYTSFKNYFSRQVFHMQKRFRHGDEQGRHHQAGRQAGRQSAEHSAPLNVDATFGSGQQSACGHRTFLYLDTGHVHNRNSVSLRTLCGWSTGWCVHGESTEGVSGSPYQYCIF